MGPLFSLRTVQYSQDLSRCEGNRFQSRNQDMPYEAKMKKKGNGYSRQHQSRTNINGFLSLSFARGCRVTRFFVKLAVGNAFPPSSSMQSRFLV
mmetsp:Transcript_34896/g.72683  ORF Transcript_34896/g.72683 Transcript_34896/m.72683 type:complete len:94 (-) Transcript_34896:111-392(-)